jgi:type II secretory pathway pseudopilin PulG
MAREKGSSLLELLVVLALAALLLTMTASAMSTLLRRTDLRGVTSHVRDILETVNADGQSKGAYRAVRFLTIGDEWFYAVYEDGNANGVHIDDINRGIDRRVEGPRRLIAPGAVARVGFPPTGAVDPDTGLPIPSGTRGIQFGQSNLCSFSDFGSCTPGTIYLTDGASAGAMVRCSGANGRIRVMYYGLSGNRWAD